MDTTLPRMVLERAQRLTDQTALRYKTQGHYRDVSWEQLHTNIHLFARALLALDVSPGDRIAICAPNSPNWVYADLGAMACGGVSVPIYHTEGLRTVLHILKDSGSHTLFVQSPLIALALADHLDQLPELRHIVLLDNTAPCEHCLNLSDLAEKAQSIPESQVVQSLENAVPSDLATIVYTSGTTGNPKGARLSHKNILSNIEACIRRFDIGPGDECLSFLPLSHVFERMAGYYLMLHQQVVINYAESIDTVPVNMGETRPTIMISVPRLYEKMYARVMERVLSGPWLKKQLFFAGLSVGRTYFEREQANSTPGSLLKFARMFFDHLVFSKVKAKLGGRLRYFVSGGAPLSTRVAEFFMAAGIPIYEGYGLTETSPVISANAPGRVRIGTVGIPLENTRVRIAEDGEILVKGPGVFSGYWEKPAETDEVFSGDWFHTGDIGELTPEGYLSITDRKKDLIITAGGENIAPQHLETMLKTDKYLSNAMVYGEKKPYLTALLVPNFDNLEQFAKSHKIDFIDHCDLVTHPDTLEMIRAQIDTLQKGLPPIQRIKRFTLLSQDFSAAQGEVTPTLKIKRDVIGRHFRATLDGMYIPEDHGVHDSGFCVIEELSEHEKD